MPDFFKGLVDARGQPIAKQVLTTEVGAATTRGVRSPLTSYPGDGLNPGRLASILREADQGQPIRFLELAETIEERDPHLIGVLGTRRRSVSQLEITVEDAGTDSDAKKHGDMIRDWLKRDELTSELFDMLDAIHKGYSFTEIVWAEGLQWWPERLEYRDPRWFDFERGDLRTPQLIGEGGERQPLPGGKFIYAPMAAKSGIPTRSGLARVLAWAWMFKAFSNRDWAIFTQTYGQPIRVGKYGPGASQDEKDTLFAAVANIAGDCAAIVPESMSIDFVQTSNVGASSDLYEKRATFLDQQVSKAVLGQTATTDAVTGGLGSGKEHRQVQEDIERSDAKQLSAHLNRDLVRIWVALEFGPQEKYPRLRIGRPEDKDVDLIARTVKAFGLPIKKTEAYALAGVSQPEDGDDVLIPHEAQPPQQPGEQEPPANRSKGRPPANDNPAAEERRRLALHAAEDADPGDAEALQEQVAIDALAGDAAQLAGPALDALLELIGGVVADPAMRDLEDVRVKLLELAPNMSSRSLALAMRQALTVAELSGRADLVDG